MGLYLKFGLYRILVYSRYNKVSLELPDYKIDSRILKYINVFNIDCANIVTRLKYLVQDPKVKIIEFKNILTENIFLSSSCVILGTNKEGQITSVLLIHGPINAFLVPDSCRVTERNGISTSADVTDATIEND